MSSTTSSHSKNVRQSNDAESRSRRTKKSEASTSSTTVPAQVAVATVAAVAPAPVVATPAPVVVAPAPVQTVEVTPASETSATTTPQKPSLISAELEKNLHFNTAYTALESQLRTLTESLKETRTAMKKLKASYDHDLTAALKSRRVRRNGATPPTGFVKKVALRKELADLINVEENTMMAIPEYTRRFCAMMKENNLRYEKDGRIFRPNERIRKVFNLPESVNESTNHRDENGFNLYNLQKYISNVNKQRNQPQLASSN